MSEKDELKADRAFEDFYNLPRLGKRRSVNELFRHYVALNKADPANRASIPTLNRSTLYEWAREGKWTERALQRDLEDVEREREDLGALRKRGYTSLSYLIEDAIATLHEVMQTGDDKLRLQASTEILNRAGVVSTSTRDPDAKPPTTRKKAARPPEDADDLMKMRWLAEQRDLNT